MPTPVLFPAAGPAGAQKTVRPDPVLAEALKVVQTLGCQRLGHGRARPAMPRPPVPTNAAARNSHPNSLVAVLATPPPTRRDLKHADAPLGLFAVWFTGLAAALPRRECTPLGIREGRLLPPGGVVLDGQDVADTCRWQRRHGCLPYCCKCLAANSDYAHNTTLREPRSMDRSGRLQAAVPGKPSERPRSN